MSACYIAPGPLLSISFTGSESASTTNTTVLYQAVGVAPQQLYTFNLKYRIAARSAVPPSIQLSVAFTGYARQTLTGFSTTPIAVTTGPLDTVINSTAQVYIPSGVDTTVVQIAMKPVRPIAPSHLPKQAHHLSSTTG